MVKHVKWEYNFSRTVFLNKHYCGIFSLRSFIAYDSLLCTVFQIIKYDFRKKNIRYTKTLSIK